MKHNDTPHTTYNQLHAKPTPHRTTQRNKTQLAPHSTRTTQAPHKHDTPHPYGPTRERTTEHHRTRTTARNRTPRSSDPPARHQAHKIKKARMHLSLSQSPQHKAQDFGSTCPGEDVGCHEGRRAAQTTSFQDRVRPPAQPRGSAHGFFPARVARNWSCTMSLWLPSHLSLRSGSDDTPWNVRARPSSLVHCRHRICRQLRCLILILCCPQSHSADSASWMSALSGVRCVGRLVADPNSLTSWVSPTCIPVSMHVPEHVSFS